MHIYIYTYILYVIALRIPNDIIQYLEFYIGAHGNDSLMLDPASAKTYNIVHIYIYTYIHTYNTIQLQLQIQIQYNTIQYSTVQYSTIQYNTIQYNTIQYNT